MADIGLPGSIPNSMYGNTINAARATYYANNQQISNTSSKSGVLTFITTHNYLYKCPAANSGIKNSQVLWF